MQRQNVTEYKIVRTEMETLKKCITDYMGFLFLLIGGTFSAWAGIAILSKGKIIFPAIGYCSLGLSLIAVMMLLVLVYKFISHNRYAGYCLLLSRELWEENQRDADLLIWEVCVDQLRASKAVDPEHVPDEYREQAQKVFKDIKEIEAGKTDGGSMRFLFKCLLRLQETYSWGFPTAIIRIFLIIVVACLSFGLYILVWPILVDGLTINDVGSKMALGVSTVVCVLQGLFWSYIALRYQSLMKGPQTVLNFCARFKPIRKNILEEHFKITARWIEFKKASY